MIYRVTITIEGEHLDEAARSRVLAAMAVMLPRLRAVVARHDEHGALRLLFTVPAPDAEVAIQPAVSTVPLVLREAKAEGRIVRLSAEPCEDGVAALRPPDDWARPGRAGDRR
jgi:hypothetical protein